MRALPAAPATHDMYMYMYLSYVTILTICTLYAPVVDHVVDAQFVDALPGSIEAVFFMHVEPSRFDCSRAKHGECPQLGMNWPGIDANVASDGSNQDCVDATSGPKCRDYATRAWRKMLSHFRLTPARLPLLSFNPFDRNTPFTDVSRLNRVQG